MNHFYIPSSRLWRSVKQLGVLACLLGVTCVAAAQSIANADAVSLSQGKSHDYTFETQGQKRTLVWITARLDTHSQGQAAAPAYALSMSLDGRALNPKNVTLLNKQQIGLAGETPKDPAQMLPVFDAKASPAGGWYLHRDTDFIYGNAPDEKHHGGLMTRQYTSHYFEYVMDLGQLNAGRHVLALGNVLNSSPAEQVHVESVRFQAHNDSALWSQSDWMQPAFLWQTPAVDELLASDKPVRLAATRGEYEPATFDVYALEDMGQLTLELGALKNESGGQIAADRMEAFYIETLQRKSLGEAAFIARIPFSPESAKRDSPELLMPLAEKSPSPRRGQFVRFHVDIHVPSDAASGVYRGEVVVREDGRVVRSVPIELTVLPFDLAEAATKYWMWRLTWSPVWEPRNVARLQDIKDHGYTGMIRTAGASFKLKRGDDGGIVVDTADIEKYVQVLEQVGLAKQTVDDNVATRAFQMSVNELLLPRYKELQAKVKAKAILPDEKKELEQLTGFVRRAAEHLDTLPEEVIDNARPRMLEVFTQIKNFSDRTGFKVMIFPVDEPDGTPWQRRWTTFAAGLAKEAGLETFSSRNDMSWEAHIDHNAFGGVIHTVYKEPEMAVNPYTGNIAFDLLPILGAFRGGENYHFTGDIDEVRIYNRALSDEEILQQRITPSEKGMMAHYSFDKGMPQGLIPDESGNYRHLKAVNRPTFVQGHGSGKAMRFNGIDQHLAPVERLHARSDKNPDGVDVSTGWSLSMWYRGIGPMFGYGYDLYTQGGKLRYTTDTQKMAWANFNTVPGHEFWHHITLVFDPADKQIKVYVRAPEARDWYRQNIHWNYMQIRSQPARNPRFKTGIMAWYYARMGKLNNVTTFCYDWNANHLYVSYPKDGDRNNPEGIWYRTVGWEGTREGIDDARYLETYFQLLRDKKNMSHEDAVDKVRETLKGIGSSYEINKPDMYFGSYDNMRQVVIEQILQLRQ